jgi:AbrB family looped-hinge helix DNA binding protein
MGKQLFPKILGTATLNEKGQLVIPKEARDNLELKPGSRMVIMTSPYRPALVIMKSEEVEVILKDISDAINTKVEE